MKHFIPLICLFLSSILSSYAQSSFFIKRNLASQPMVEISFDSWDTLNVYQQQSIGVEYRGSWNSQMFLSDGSLIELSSHANNSYPPFKLWVDFNIFSVDTTGGIAKKDFQYRCSGDFVDDVCWGSFRDGLDNIYTYSYIINSLGYEDSQRRRLLRLNTKTSSVDTIIKHFVPKEDKGYSYMSGITYRDKIVLIWPGGYEQIPKTTLVQVYDYHFKLQEEFTLDGIAADDIMVRENSCTDQELYLFSSGSNYFDGLRDTVRIYSFDLEQRSYNHVIDFKMKNSWRSSLFCAPNPELDQSECFYDIDLDEDNSSALGRDFATTFCKNGSTAFVADEDLILHSWLPPDSIVFQLQGIRDANLEHLVFQGTNCTFVDRGNGVFVLSLVDADHTLNDFYIEALTSLLYYDNDAPHPTPGARTIDIHFHNAQLSQKVRTTIDVQKSPFAGKDTLLSVCSNRILDNISSRINLPPDGSWSKSFMDGDSFDPNQDTFTSNDYIVTSQHCGSDTMTLDIEVLPLNEKVDTLSLCPSDSVRLNGSFFHPGELFIDTLDAMASACDTVLMLRILALPSASTSDSVFVCPGQSFVFEGNIYNSGEHFSTLRPAIEGCDTIVDIGVVSHEPLSTDILPTYMIYQDSTISYNASWSLTSIFPDAYIDFTQTMISLTSSQEAPSSYVLYWSNNQGCQDSTSLTVKYGKVDQNANFFFPNVVAIHPNIPVNGYFALHSAIKTSYTLDIYDRWGNKVHKASYDNTLSGHGWNVAQSNVLPGVYTFRASIPQFRLVFFGSFTVL